MTRFKYDRSGKWLVDHHGDAILRLGGVTDIVEWRAVQPEVVQPRQTPDGLLEVRRAGQQRSNWYVVELATYPDPRIAEQLADDVMLVYQDRRLLPEVLVVVLHPKGNLQVPSEWHLRSRDGWTQARVSWHVVELWKVPAQQLLATEDPGLMPWVPLAHIDGPPELVFRQCRAVIDQKALPQEHANLLAVSQVLAGLRYDNASLLALFGGPEVMIESPVLRRFVAQRLHKFILNSLEARFGPVPGELAITLAEITDDDWLEQLGRQAATCPNLEAFQQHLLSPPPPNGPTDPA